LLLLACGGKPSQVKDEVARTPPGPPAALKPNTVAAPELEQVPVQLSVADSALCGTAGRAIRSALIARGVQVVSAPAPIDAVLTCAAPLQGSVDEGLTFRRLVTLSVSGDGHELVRFSRKVVTARGDGNESTELDRAAVALAQELVGSGEVVAFAKAQRRPHR
jgi:hypothetical protein